MRSIVTGDSLPRNGPLGIRASHEIARGLVAISHEATACAHLGKPLAAEILQCLRKIRWRREIEPDPEVPTITRTCTPTVRASRALRDSEITDPIKSRRILPCDLAGQVP